MIRVLIIDDDRLSLSGIRTMLPWEKHQMQIVGEAYNGKEGLRFLEKHTVDLVMLDLAMPIMDGLTFIQKCKELHPMVQYVVMTFHEDFSYIQEALRLGVIDYISKLKLEEEDLDSLLSRVSEVVHRHISAAENESAPKEGKTDNIQDVAQRVSNPLWICDDLYLWETERMLKGKNYAVQGLETALRETILRLEITNHFHVLNIGRIRSAEDVIQYLYTCRQHITEKAQQGDPNTTEARLIVAAELMRKNYQGTCLIQEIADASGLSRSYLSSCFSRYFGITPNEFIRRKRIFESMKLIMEGTHSLTDIAMMVGYDNYQYYKKMFLEVRKESPKEFRRIYGVPSEPEK